MKSSTLAAAALALGLWAPAEGLAKPKPAVVPAKAPAAKADPAAAEGAAMLRKKAAADRQAGRAISLLRGAAALTPDPRVYADLATAYQRSGQFDLAAHELRR
jgi:Flp pilus assembly protein TadD